mmetsp:Transcript_26481/g.81411  ORF Transcript_26481/g.81411 Transcript_26481/m.81411 type:complete len:82 (-) Transcript_26481:82-327(-)
MLRTKYAAPSLENVDENSLRADHVISCRGGVLVQSHGLVSAKNESYIVVGSKLPLGRGKIFAQYSAGLVEFLFFDISGGQV